MLEWAVSVSSEPQSANVPSNSGVENHSTQTLNTSVTYSEKTNRILAWVQVIRSISPVIWAIVIFVVIIPLMGQIFLTQAFSPQTNTPKSNPDQTVIIQPSLDWSKVDEAIASALTNAHDQAENYASEELDLWINELKDRVDSNFLDWYFGYFNQKQIEFKSFFVQLSSGVRSLIQPNYPNPSDKVAEVITRDFQEEFAKRVLRPQIAQLRLERLTQQTVKHYLNDLTVNLKEIPLTYRIPQADWNRYLNDIAISINDTEGNLSTLSLKVLMGGSAYLAVKPLVTPLVLKVGSKMVGKLAGKTGAKIALKTGASLTGKVAAGLLDCTVGVGILLWDIWDTYHTAAVEKPILQETIFEYLDQVEASILENPETGVMTVIDQIEHKIIQSIDESQSRLSAVNSLNDTKSTVSL